MRTEICVFGSYAAALVMETERIPLTGETLLATRFRETWGGKGSDMAVQSARLRSYVHFLGVVGTDAFGDEFVRLMRQEGVDIAGLRRTDRLKTGAGFIIKDSAGNNIITVDMAANSLFCVDDVDRSRSIIKRCDVALAQLEIPKSTALHGLKTAHDLGLITILNPAPASNLLNEDLSFVDYLVPNETEARVCAGFAPDQRIDNDEVAVALRSTGCRNVVMTLGENGALLYGPTGSLHIDAFPVRTVDSNGAGDAFNGALAVALGEGLTQPEALRFATAAASLSCTAWETVDSYHDRQAVEALIRRGGADDHGKKPSSVSEKKRPNAGWYKDGLEGEFQDVERETISSLDSSNAKCIRQIGVNGHR